MARLMDTQEAPRVVSVLRIMSKEVWITEALFSCLREYVYKCCLKKKKREKNYDLEEEE